MVTNARIGHGNLFQLLATIGSPPLSQWVTLGEVKSVTPPSFSRDAQDATHTESEDGWREFIPGLSDGGEISCELNFVPASQTTGLIWATFASVAQQRVRILFNDGNPDSSPPTSSYFECAGIITGFPIEAPIDDVQSATLTLKVSGKPIFVQASGA